MFDLPLSSHSALPRMTVSDALAAQQAHAECPITICPIKLQARTFLVGKQRRRRKGVRGGRSE
ncbi:hypothetical protein [Nocardia aurantiaca]|uniref:hypothetical protein n=1 Tax=Nocardia aurantiaca TaxID=2675850 RepID=UPI0018ABD86B|nr:hypothetical protein [Nocardia aurantiaca]